VGPERIDTLFGAVSRKKQPPDIVTSSMKREVVIQYIYDKYSAKPALAAAVVSYRGRSALREVARRWAVRRHQRRIVELDLGWSASGSAKRAPAYRSGRSVSRHVIELANEIVGFPVISQHVGSFVITGTGSTRSFPSSRRRWTSARWSSGTRTISTR
jgi:error-prone DNA polymerase